MKYVNDGSVRVLTFSFFAGILILAASTAEAERLSLSAYFKNYSIAVHPPDYGNSADPKTDPMGSMNNRLRLNATYRQSRRLTFSTSYDISARLQHRDLFNNNLFSVGLVSGRYRVADLDRQISPTDNKTPASFAIYQNLDRLNVGMAFPHFDLILGRQAIAWGSARAVNPTDILAPYAFNELDTEDRPGVDAARIRVPIGFMGELDAGYVAGKDFKADGSAWYFRGKYYLLHTDISAVVVRFNHHLMTGFDLARAIGGAGFWTEIAWVDVDAFDANHCSGYNNYFRGSIGGDYSFSGNTYAFIEYHFNQVGSNQADEYHQILSHPAYSDGAVYLMGQHYLIPGVSWQVSPLVTAGGQILANLGDPSLLVAPNLEYNIAENVYLSAGAYVGIGSAPSVTIEEISQLRWLQFDSEFGAYSDVYFVSLRAYF